MLFQDYSDLSHANDCSFNFSTSSFITPFTLCLFVTIVKSRPGFISTQIISPFIVLWAGEILVMDTDWAFRALLQASLLLVYSWKWLYVLIIPSWLKGKKPGVHDSFSFLQEKKKKRLLEGIVTRGLSCVLLAGVIDQYAPDSRPPRGCWCCGMCGLVSPWRSPHWCCWVEELPLVD